jgi:hypothetical protein
MKCVPLNAFQVFNLFRGRDFIQIFCLKKF